MIRLHLCGALLILSAATVAAEEPFKVISTVDAPDYRRPACATRFGGQAASVANAGQHGLLV